MNQLNFGDIAIGERLGGAFGGPWGAAAGALVGGFGGDLAVKSLQNVPQMDPQTRLGLETLP